MRQPNTPQALTPRRLLEMPSALCHLLLSPTCRSVPTRRTPPPPPPVLALHHARWPLMLATWPLLCFLSLLAQLRFLNHLMSAMQRTAPPAERTVSCRRSRARLHPSAPAAANGEDCRYCIHSIVSALLHCNSMTHSHVYGSPSSALPLSARGGNREQYQLATQVSAVAPFMLRLCK